MKGMFGNAVLKLGKDGIELDEAREQGVVSPLGDDGCLYLSCFQQSSGIFSVRVLAPEEMTEDKAMKKIWSKFQEQLGVFSVTLSESSSCKKLQNSRSSSPPSAGSCVQPSPAGPFFCLVLVVPSLIWRKNGALCQCSSRFYSP